MATRERGAPPSRHAPAVPRRAAWPLLALLALPGCEERGGLLPPALPEAEGASPRLSCDVAEADLFNGGPGRDGIPALVNPALVPLTSPEAAYLDAYAAQAGDELSPTPRVVGLTLGDVEVAIPHNILWWHEIVNADLGGRRLTVSYCPLTGSALVFDATDAGTRRFGVSGLIFQNNLVMFDEETGSLWPQMCRSARIGERSGFELAQVPAVEMTWDAWRERHPASLTLSDETGFTRDYERFPYAGYESNDFLLFSLPLSLDRRRPMKERTLGVLTDRRALAFPFGELERTGSRAVVRIDETDEPLIVLWDTDAQAAAAYHARTAAGDPVQLAGIGGRIVDEAGGEWDVEGRALSGPLAGARLEPYRDAYVAFWFAWTSFHPGTGLWLSE